VANNSEPKDVLLLLPVNPATVLRTILSESSAIRNYQPLPDAGLKQHPECASPEPQTTGRREVRECCLVQGSGKRGERDHASLVVFLIQSQGCPPGYFAAFS
jgi:hypothetical protein